MKTILKKVAATLCGIIAFFLTLAVNELGTDMLYYALYQRWTHGQANFGIVPDYPLVGAAFYWGYPMAVGCTTAYFFWYGVPTQSKRTLLYLLLLAIVGPLTFINYQSSDELINLWIQAGFNLFVAFVGYLLILIIRKKRAQSLDGQALQSISILLISSLLLALPLFYTAIFLAVALRLIDHTVVNKIPESVPPALAGLVGIIATLLSGLNKLRGDESK